MPHEEDDMPHKSAAYPHTQCHYVPFSHSDQLRQDQCRWHKDHHQLEQLLAARNSADPDSSYTASLYARGTKRFSQKVGEEGVEVALAATSGDKAELVCESADLIYHLIVLLQDQGLSMNDVVNKLKERHK